ncbi:MAG: precorrin-4 C(11)-methyltransferase [Gemmatimonadaceae bacterium]|nr:precorrin-4 C(11)-methyltransferase [Gloeobacterales cyanobacterium ES-bin-141]
MTTGGAKSGTVYIVGAGPGDPDLITLRGQRLLSTADAVFYAGSLVPEGMLRWCRADALLVDTRTSTLEAILPHMFALIEAGKSIVRLHSGDPCLYGATHEQMAALLEAGVEFEIVPGISAFQAAAASLKVELTVPGLVQTIILTRTSGRTGMPESEELAALAAHRASLCLYLSARHARECEAKLLAHYPPDTPVAICYRLGWPDERIVRARLDQMAAVTRDEKLIRTTLYLISPALAATPARSRLYNPTHSHLFRPSQTAT